MSTVVDFSALRVDNKDFQFGILTQHPLTYVFISFHPPEVAQFGTKQLQILMLEH